jgi:glycosyltransferase involved in cell wall biosynthesis
VRTPILAIIANEQTPYRQNLHRRIVAELPDVRLWSLFTHESPDAPDFDQSIQPVFFGEGEPLGGALTPRALLREWRKGGRITRWLAGHSVDQVILYGYNDPARLRILHWCKREGVACHLFGDSNILSDNATGLKRWVKRRYLNWVVKSCAGLLYCGRLGREYFERYGANPDQLHPFPYEPDYAIVANAGQEEAQAAITSFDLTPGRRRLLFAGRMVHVKRPDLLIEAFAAIAEARPEWDLVLAGEGPLRAGLEKALPALLRPRVHFTGFVASRELLAGLYAASEVFVLPSDYEPWGVVLAEAATRLALVASSVTGSAADLVEDGRNGRIFDAGYLNSLIDALMHVTDERHLPRMQAESPRVLEAWRSQTDPIATLSRILEVDRVCSTA